ncbi:MAG TPA: TlpA disulfide reductase family protein [Bryobacteraceae bacterium]|nr:TlpA disulfide reductase family protein [Bryobacteraceae bacterium]
MISRSGLESNGAEGGGYLQPGDWTSTVGVRHVYSHVHFSGPTQNFSRAQLGTEVQSKTNIDDVMVTYQLTPKISLNGTIPFVYASRRQQSQYGTLHTSGIGDVSLGASTWLRKPKSSKSGLNNAQLGLGLLMPTGNDRQNNVIATSYGATPTTQYPDYSVQPGGGSWGMLMSWQAFQSVGNNTVLFVDGDYVMTQGGHHNFWTSHGGTSNGPPAATPGLTQFDAIQDQYMVEIGASHPAPKIKGLGLTLSVRDEGVPARNLIGDDLGFRRPGFGIALTPGLIYTRGNSMLQFSVGKVLIRDRTKSVAEQVNGVHEGDAAFANYVWMVGYTLKMPNRRRVAETPQVASVRPVPRELDSFKPFDLKTIDGKKQTLKDVSGKVTLVNFFFPTCPYCNVELPEVQKIYDKYKDQGLSVVWINILPEEVKLIPGWQMAKNLNVPILIGGSQDSLMKDYRITSTPATYLLGQNGQILFHKDGYERGDEKVLESKIANALSIPPSGSALTSNRAPLCQPLFPF